MVMDISQEKKLLRKKFKEQRKNISLHDRILANERIFENLVNLNEIENADYILTFISFGSEPDTLKFSEYILSNGKKLAAAKCTAEKGVMNFHIIKSLDDLEKGSYGIPEPKNDIPFLSDEEIDKNKVLCIVPGYSFSEKGYRLGYGGGYYDRFLSEHKNVKTIGICFDEMISDEIPVGEYDIPVSLIVTDRKITEIT